ncbi:hypothetical protein AB4851_22540 [Burkholderia sp. 22PA0099]|uniref:hypothetical protein n=1 Tax=Burkholderia sp. 22PA0099 TaxID=3237372 RepID=UPI0039C17952
MNHQALTLTPTPDKETDRTLTARLTGRNVYEFPRQQVTLKRHNKIKEAVITQFDAQHPNVVAAVLIVLRSDGSMSTCAKGCEAETAALLLQGLKQLGSRIEYAFR